MFRQSTDYQFQILFQNISVAKNSNPQAKKTWKFNTTNTKAYNFEFLLFALQNQILFSYEES
jgi:hypothetical protein